MLRQSIILAPLAALHFCIAPPMCASPERDPFVNFLDYSKTKSEAIYDKVERGLSTIPKDIKQALIESGYSVTIAPTMLSAMPGWDGAVPRGWSEDSNYDNVGGLFQSRQLRIVIPEQVQSRKNPNIYQPNERTLLTIRHELGHAYDHYQGKVSMSDDFVDAYTADADKLNSHDEARFAYFLQPNGAGYSELFAELFGAVYTPDAELNDRYRDLLKAFPRTTKLMLKLNPHRPASTKQPANKPTSADKAESVASTPSDKATPAEQSSATASLSHGQSQMVQRYQQMILLCRASASIPSAIRS